jgi:membrane protease YdiL (CAAX protease family)
MVALVGASIASALLVGSDTPTDELSLGLATLLTMSLWPGYLGVPVATAYLRGNGPVVDYTMQIQWIDLPVGLIAGLAAQIGAVVVAWPVARLFDVDTGESAREVVGRASGSGIALMVVVVVFAGPVVEEIFFRGLLFRSIEARSGVPWAIGASAVVFAALHFQPYLAPGLALFGLVAAGLVARTGRLGPAVTAHMAFNGATVAYLLSTR